MTKKQINDQFVKFTPLLHKLSHQCASRCGRPEADVFPQACFLFMQATKTYDAKYAFRPYMQSHVHHGLIGWGIKNDLPADPANLLEPTTSRTPADTAIFNEWLSNLKEEVREVAMIVLNGPIEVLDIVDTAAPKAVRGALRHYLRKTKGWSWPKIWSIIRETKAAVAMLSIK